jgi:hypothetical protein
VDRIAADTGWEAQLPVFQRDPAAFRRLLVEGLRLAVRLAREAAPVQRAWCEAQPRFASRAFWRGYLGLPPATANDDAAPPLNLPATGLSSPPETPGGGAAWPLLQRRKGQWRT